MEDIHAESPVDGWSQPVRVGAFILLYYGAALLGMTLSYPGTNSSPICPEAGVALAMVMLMGWRFWPAIWVGAFAASLQLLLTSYGTPLPTALSVSIISATAETGEVVIGWFLLTRVTGSRAGVWSGKQALFEVINVFRFALVVVAMCVLPASLGTVGLCLGGIIPWSSFPVLWLIWWFGNATGLLVVTPFLLNLSRPRGRPLNHWRWIEAIAAFTLLMGTSSIVFGGWFVSNGHPLALVFLTQAPLVWIAMRFNQGVTETALLIILIGPLWYTVHEAGPFVLTNQYASLLVLLLYVWVISLTTFTLNTDVTARKRAEASLKSLNAELEERVRARTAELSAVNEALHKSAEEFADLYNNAPCGFHSVDKDDMIIRINDTELRWLGYSREEMFGNTQCLNIVAPESRKIFCGDFVRFLMERGEIRNLELDLIRKDGSILTVLLSASALVDANGNFIMSRSTTVDITERKQAEQALAKLHAELEQRVEERTLQLQRSLEKEGLLRKEVHHRVKNNLQVISSLLFLQGRRLHDPHTLEMLKESQARIHSIALIHEMLYKNSDLTKIDFNTYARQLAVSLVQSYQDTARKVELEIDAEEICLGLDAAVPCGLIINELVSNAFKYAFPGERSGKIQIMLHHTPGDAFRLVIFDNGVGLAHEIDSENPTTMGLQIVRDLARQLEGNIEFQQNGGTTVLITFPNRDSAS